MNPPDFKHPILALGLTFLIFITSQAGAETAIEHGLLAEKSPHLNLPVTGKSVRVHWVHQVQQLGDDTINADRLKALKDSVQACITTHDGSGQLIAKVSAWPDLVSRVRLDVYMASNRVVTYAHGVSYALNAMNCGLIESESKRVTVRSSVGICTVDLMAKVASGNCVVEGHQAAPAIQSVDAGHTGLPAGSPALAMLPRPTGEVHRVGTQLCDVAINPLDPDQGTQCYARGGAFHGHGNRIHPQGSALVVEATSKRGLTLKAVDVALDLTVPDQILTPQRLPGIRTD